MFYLIIKIIVQFTSYDFLEYYFVLYFTLCTEAAGHCLVQFLASLQEKDDYLIDKANSINDSKCRNNIPLNCFQSGIYTNITNNWSTARSSVTEIYTLVFMKTEQSLPLGLTVVPCYIFTFTSLLFQHQQLYLERKKLCSCWCSNPTGKWCKGKRFTAQRHAKKKIWG